MRRAKWIVLAAVLIMDLLVAGNVFAAPKILCEAPTWEFPTVKEGEKPEHIFKIKNTGDEVLEIKRVRASCGCTAAKPSTNSLKPGEEADINVAFNTAGRSGKQHKTVYVYTNDPKNSMLKLSITGEVEKKPAPRLIIRPPSWNLQTITFGEIKRYTATIMNTGNQPLEIKSIKPSRDSIKAKLLGPSTVAPGGSVNMELSCYADFVKPQIREKITIETNVPRRKISYLHIYGRIDLDAIDLSLSVLGIRQVGNDTEIDLHMQNSQPAPLTIKVPDAKEPNMATVPAESLKMLSIKVPNDKILESPQKESDKQMGNPLKDLKIEISLPLLSDETKAKSRANPDVPPPPPDEKPRVKMERIKNIPPNKK